MSEENKVQEAKVEEVLEKKEEIVAEKVSAEEGKKCCGMGSCKNTKNCKRNGIIAAVILLALLVAASYGYKAYQKKFDIGQVAIKEKVQKFIETNVPPGTKAEIKSITKENNLYKLSITVADQDVPVFVSTDGKKLFTNANDLEPKTTDTAKPAVPQAEAPKSDKPDVKLFVMSYCPYGTQIEKGIIPVVDTLKDKISYSLEFVDYIMHEKKEADENLRQYCIQKNQPTALNKYLTCFLKKGQGTEASCMATSGVNAASTNACMKQADTQFNVSKQFADKSTYKGQFPPFDVNKEDNAKYGVQGSPTLVINSVPISVNRDSASILKAICSAFNNPPKECDAQLSSAAPAAGFGDGTAPASAGGSAAAGCGAPTN
jgi:hypothetical protein